MPIPPDPDSQNEPPPPRPPEVVFADLEWTPTTTVDGVNGEWEPVVACVMDALHAGALVVVGPGLPVGLARVRIGREGGSAWKMYGPGGTASWHGRGTWNVTAHVPGWPQGGGTVRVHLGKWRTPGDRRPLPPNAKPDTPGPLSVAGIRRAVARIEARIEGRPLPP
ncbi:hypothetical protein [Rubrivirga sp. IMCC43871]|uniref:hypothetical protein n=1 Tax=Rubrivirga sp. IMCC43871 TaxID=3391575 RepID=UPI00398FF9B4